MSDGAKQGSQVPPMKILHVFDGFRVGGTEVRTCRIMNGLGPGYQHQIVACNGNFEAMGLVEEQVAADPIDFERHGAGRLSLLHRAGTTLKRLRPDLLVAYEWGAIDWVLVNTFLHVCPTLMTIEGFEETERFGQKKSRFLLRRFLYPRCATLVVCSKVLYRLAESSWRVDRERIVHIPNGVDCTRFSPAAEPEEPGKGVHLAIVGSLIKLKNHRKLLISMAALADTVDLSLVIAGDGSERQNLEQMCRELGLGGRVSFAGHLEDPAPLLRSADLFCLVSETEQMPMVILEAMATGLPVVATDVGDVKEMVSRANRPFIVDPHGQQPFTRALERLCRDRELRRRIGRENEHRCRTVYDETMMIEHYRELYRTVSWVEKRN